MSDIFDYGENSDGEDYIPKPKEKKKRRELTPERKEQLKEQLRKGRETSLNKRKKAKMYKDITKKEQEDEMDKVIKESIMKKSKNEDMENEIKKLREELENVRIEKKVKTPIREPKEPKVTISDQVKEDSVKTDIQEQTETLKEQKPLIKEPIKKTYSTRKKNMWD